MALTGLEIKARHLRVIAQSASFGPFWTGSVKYITTWANAVADATALYGTGFPGVTGFSLPICNSVEMFEAPGEQPGRALLIAGYETPRIVGRAILASRPRGRMRRKTRDTSGNVIEGPDPADPRNKYEITQGDNQIEENDTDVIIKTAYSLTAFTLSTYQALEGCVNASQVIISGWGTMAAGTVRFISVSAQSAYGDAIINLDYHLRWSGTTTWNQKVKNQKGCYYVRRLPVLDKDLAQVLVDGTAIYRDSQVFLPGYSYATTTANVPTASASAATCAIFPTADFSSLAGLTIW